MKETTPLTKAIVTAGGTKEYIDDVRFVTNFSTGNFGIEIARALHNTGYDVTVASPKETPLLTGGAIDGVAYENFTNTESLQEILLSKNEPHVIFHAAAVSDYTPVEATPGKISSDKDEWTLAFKRTPKILGQLRGHYGHEAFLVGFKLLSGVSRQELIRVAENQTKRDHLNMTVANDLQKIGNGRHPMIAITPEGGALNIDGTRAEVAKKLVEFTKKRANVTWYRSKREQYAPPTEKELTDYVKAVDFAQRTHLLYDSSGNASVRSGDGLLVTPRQVDKSKAVAITEFAKAEVDHNHNIVRFDGALKSSIDTAVSDSVYRAYPDVNTLLHFHKPWGTFLEKTKFPYPCGVKEEAAEILERLSDHPEVNTDFAIELMHHGVLMALPEGGIDRLTGEWEDAQVEFKTHLEDVGQSASIEDGVLKPIFANTEIVGVVLEAEPGSVVFLRENARGKGVGRKVAQQLIDREMKIQTIEACGVIDFYRKFGFSEEVDENGLYTFTPPALPPTDQLFDSMDEWKIKE